jgi:hypothetical protein
MKSEERIVELLAEYLKKTDQQMGRMDRTDRNIDIMSKAILEHSLRFNTVNDEIKHLRQDQLVVNDEFKHLRQDQSVIIQELLSLSKRVTVIESGN